MKKSLLLVLTLLLSLVLVACGGTKPKPHVVSDDQKVQEAEAELSIDADLSNVTQDLVLDTKIGDVMVTWSSNNVDVVTNNGKVTRPEYKNGDAQVVLTATLTLNDSSAVKVFNIVVKRKPVTDEERVQIDAESLKLRYFGDGGSVDTEKVLRDIVLVLEGLEGSSITWSAEERFVTSGGYSNQDALYIINNRLEVNRPDKVDGGEDQSVTVWLKAVVTYNNASKEVVFNLTLKERPTDEQGMVDELKESLELDIPVVLYEELSDKPTTGIDCVAGTCIIGNDIELIQEDLFGYGATYDWVSSDTSVLTNDGKVIRPDERTLVKLTATIYVGSKGDTKTFDIYVKAKEEDNKLKLDNAKDDLSIQTNLTANIREINLPGFDSTGDVEIFWESTGDSSKYISGDGYVLHPKAGQPAVTVKLKATFKSSVCELYNEKDPINNDEPIKDDDTSLRIKVDPNCKSDWDEMLEDGWNADRTENSVIKEVENEYGNVIREYIVVDGVEYDVEVKDAINSKTGEKTTVYFYYHTDVKEFDVTVQPYTGNESSFTYRAIGGKIHTLNPHNFEYSSEGGVLGATMGVFYGLFPDPDSAYISEPGACDCDPFASDYGDLEDGNPEAYGCYFDGYVWDTVFAKGLPQDVNGDGYVWRIEIRDDLKWWNGDPITVDDYMYSYKMLLDHDLANYRAYVLYDDLKVVGAKEYYLHGGGFESVGIKKINNYVIEFTLEEPETQDSFMSSVSSVILSPIYEEYYEAGMNEDRTKTSYGSTLDMYMGHGGYKLNTWTQGLVRRYTINEYFPRKNAPYLQTKWTDMNERIIQDSDLALQLFEKGELDTVGVSGENAKSLENAGKYIDRTYQTSSPAVWKISINTNRTDLANKDLREALYYGIDRKSFTSEVAYPHKPIATMLSESFYAQAIYNNQVHGMDKPYRLTDQGKKVEEIMKVGAVDNFGYDETRAINAFNKAYSTLRPNGGVIKLELLTFDGSDELKSRSEWIEKHYEELFGRDKLDIVLKFNPSNVAYNHMMANNYDLAWNSWTGSTFDPWSLFDVYTTDFRQKLEPYKNSTFDNLVEKTTSGLQLKNVRNDNEYKQKVDYLRDMELLLLGNYNFIPVYTPRAKTIFSDRIELVVENSVPGLGYSTTIAIITKSDQNLVE